MSLIKDTKNNIKKIYIYEILNNMLFFVPILVLFLQENGLSITEVMLLQSIYAILISFLEIPTGYFSDKFGRKITLILGAVNMLLAFIIYSIGYNFFYFLTAEILFAIAISLQSGTLSAITYDSLKEYKEENKYKKIWGNVMFYGMMSVAFSTIIGGLIAQYDLRYTFYAGIPFFILLIIISLSLKEPAKYKNIIKKGEEKRLIDEIKLIFFNEKKLKRIIIYSGIIFAFNDVSFRLYQPYLEITGIDIAYFGVIIASYNIFSAYVSKYTYKIEQILGEKYSFFILGFLVSISYLLMSNFIFLLSFSFCFIQQFVKGYKNVIISEYINKLCNSNLRATILSIESLFSRFLYALIAPFIGLVTDIFSLREALLLLGVISFFFSISIVFIFRKYKIT